MFLSEKTTKYKEKVQWKSAKTAISGIFPAFSAGKKILSKVGLGHVMGIANKHLCAKNQKKLMKESRENVKKTGFPAYFWYFRPEKVFLKNRTPPCFGHCYYAFLNKQSVKTNEEILRKCQKNGFSGIFPAFSAGNEFFFSKIWLCHILNIAILHLCAKNQEKLMSQSWEKLVTNEQF